jgi:flagellar motor switch protein FliG
VENIPGLRKAAVMLTNLPVEEAAVLLAKLGPKRAAVVSKEMAKMVASGGADQQTIFEEFAHAIPAFRASAADRPQAIESIRRQIGAFPFGFLHDVDGHSLLALLIDEQPQTIALVVCHLAPAQGAEIIAGLPGPLQLAVIRRIATMSEISPEVIRDVERGLLTSVMNQPVEAADGIACVSEIFSLLDQNVKGELLDRLAQEDPVLADEVGRLLHVTGMPSLKNASRALSASKLRTAPAKAA